MLSFLFYIINYFKRLKNDTANFDFMGISLLSLAVSTACTIVVGYVTFKVLCSIKEKGLQVISDWFVGRTGEK